MEHNYIPKDNRYQQITYRRCGRSGLMLPSVSLGLWHNFGHVDDFANFRSILHQAFDRGITHFDLANNYGPPPGSAEENFGKIMSTDFKAHRDELIISTKAGHGMWPGPYGDWGSKKHLIASMDQSLKRLGLEYVDIFYSHRPDPNTPLEETMMTLDQLVRQGKALYVGISKYSPEETKKACAILKQLGTPCIIHQTCYSMLERTPEDGLMEVIDQNDMGAIAFSPLAQGVLTDRYLQGIPENSRAAKPHGFLRREQITPQLISKIEALNKVAKERNQTLSQMAIAWLLKDPRLTSVIIGASSVKQLNQNIDSLLKTDFSPEQLVDIDKILAN